MRFTLEEIYLIQGTYSYLIEENHSANKDLIIYNLKKIRKELDDEPSIVEMANNALEKLKKASEQEFTELINYSL